MNRMARIAGLSRNWSLVTSTIFSSAGKSSSTSWEVWSEPAPSGAQLAEVVRAQWFAVVGLSVSCDAAVERLPGVIRSVRRASRNPGLGGMVGGRVFFDHPELAAQVGADATATDGRQAALQAETLLALLAGRAESR